MKIANMLSILLLVALFSACEKEQESELPFPEQERTQIIDVAQQVTNTMLSTLQTELKSALATGDIPAAIRMCNVKAIPLTDSAAVMEGYDIKIKRVSFKYRNPDNKPDTLEAGILRFFEQRVADGDKLPPHFLQKFVTPTTPAYRFYKPLFIQPLCLTCHGPENEMKPEVKKTLAKLYPDDRATGYQLGDFRGVARVEIRPKMEPRQAMR